MILSAEYEIVCRRMKARWVRRSYPTKEVASKKEMTS
jgi:hypothetical protein